MFNQLSTRNLDFIIGQIEPASSGGLFYFTYSPISPLIMFHFFALTLVLGIWHPPHYYQIISILVAGL